MITRTITNAGDPFVDGSGNPIVGAKISFTLINNKGVKSSGWDVLTGERIAAGPITVETDSNGVFTVDLWPTNRADKVLYWNCSTNIENVSDFFNSLNENEDISWVTFRHAIVDPFQLQSVLWTQAKALLASSGYEFIGDYDIDGPLTVSRLNQVFTKAGEYWRASTTLAVPYVTVDNWTTDVEKFVTIGDSMLRQDLKYSVGSGLVGYSDTATYPSGSIGAYLQYRQFGGGAVDPREFGAIPSEESTAAIQDALDYAATLGTETLEGTGAKVSGGGREFLISDTVYVRNAEAVGLVDIALKATGSGWTSEPLVVVAAGQSNMKGNPDATGGTFHSNPLVYARLATSLGGTMNWRQDPNFETTTYYQGIDKLTPVGGGANNAALAFCHRLAIASKRPVYLLLHAVGNKNISEWIGSGTASPMYADLKSYVENGLSVPGKTAIDVFLWQQGENNSADSGSEYAAKLETLLTQLEAESWFSADTPFITGELLDTNSIYQYVSKGIRSAMVTRGRQGQWVDSAGLTHVGDNVHFDGPSLYDLGFNRYWNALTATTFKWSKPMVKVTGAKGYLERVTLDGSMMAGGAHLNAGLTKISDSNVFNYQDYGTWLDGVDARATLNTFTQWFNGQDEFADQNNWTARGIYVDRADTKIFQNIIRWNGVNIELGADAGTTLIHSNHLYNGGSGVYAPTNTKNIVKRGSKASILNNYLDNGEVDIHTPSILMWGNQVLHNTDNVDNDYFLKVYSNKVDKTTNDLVIGGWSDLSAVLKDGTIPFIQFVGDGGDNTWAGDYSNLVTLNAEGSLPQIIGDYVISNTDTDGSPVLTLFSPGGAGVGSKLRLMDKDTTDLASAPFLRSSGNDLRLASEGTTRFTRPSGGAGKATFDSSDTTGVTSSLGSLQLLTNSVPQVEVADNGTLHPTNDGTQNLGNNTHRWDRFFGNNIVVTPQSSVTPASVGEMTFELPSDTALNLKVKGSDSVVRTFPLSVEINSLQELRDYVGSATSIYVKGHTTPGDGGGGVFNRLSAGGYVDDNGITVVPTGGDGSVAWVRSDSGATKINAKWFGPSVDLQALFSMGGSIYLPAGDYTHSTQLVINTSDTSITGDGKDKTRILSTSSSGIKFIGPNLENVSVTDLSLIGDYSTSNAIGLHLDRVIRGSNFRNLFIRGYGLQGDSGAGVYVGKGDGTLGTWSITLDTLTVEGCARGIVIVDSQNVTVSSCVVRLNLGNSFYSRNWITGSIVGGTFENSDSTRAINSIAVFLQYSRNIAISGIYTENSIDETIKLSNCRAVTVTGSRINGYVSVPVSDTYKFINLVNGTRSCVFTGLTLASISSVNQIAINIDASSKFNSFKNIDITVPDTYLAAEIVSDLGEGNTFSGVSRYGYDTLYSGKKYTEFTPTLSFQTNGDFAPTIYVAKGRVRYVSEKLAFIEVALQFDTNAYTTSSGQMVISGLPVTPEGFSQLLVRPLETVFYGVDFSSFRFQAINGVIKGGTNDIQLIGTTASSCSYFSTSHILPSTGRYYFYISGTVPLP